MRLTVERRIGVTARDEKIVRLPRAWDVEGFSVGRRLRLIFDGERITLEPVSEEAEA